MLLASSTLEREENPKLPTSREECSEALTGRNLDGCFASICRASLTFCSKSTWANAAAASAWALPSCFRASGLCGESHAKSLCKAGSATASTSKHKSWELHHSAPKQQQ